MKSSEVPFQLDGNATDHACGIGLLKESLPSWPACAKMFLALLCYVVGPLG
jgi:hypothetical protein